MPDHARSTVNARQRRVGAAMRMLREQNGLTIARAAAAIEVSTTKISRLERGGRAPQYEDVAALLMVYRAPRKMREQVLRLLRDADRPSWLHQYDLDVPDDVQNLIDYEDEATDIRNYEILLIPGLLQIEPYARAVISNFGMALTEKQIDDRVRARMARQLILSRPNRPRLQVITHEVALRQRIGGPAVMREQLRHLLRMAERPAISVRVVPLIADAHPGLETPFAILDQPDGLTVVLIDNKVSSAYLEQPPQLDVYRVSFNELLAVAYGEQRSAELIESIIAELPEVEEGAGP